MRPEKSALNTHQNQQGKTVATNLPQTRDGMKFLQAIPSNPREWRVGRKVFAAQNQMTVNPPGLECLFGMHKDPAAYNVDLDQVSGYTQYSDEVSFRKKEKARQQEEMKKRLSRQKSLFTEKSRDEEDLDIEDEVSLPKPDDNDQTPRAEPNVGSDPHEDQAESVASRTRSQTKRPRGATPRRSNVSSIFAPKFTSTPKAGAMRLRTPRTSHFHLVESSTATQTTPQLVRPSALATMNKMGTSDKAVRSAPATEAGDSTAPAAAAADAFEEDDDHFRAEAQADASNLAGSMHTGVASEPVRPESNAAASRGASIHTSVASATGRPASKAAVSRRGSAHTEVAGGPVSLESNATVSRGASVQTGVVSEVVRLESNATVSRGDSAHAAVVAVEGNRAPVTEANVVTSEGTAEEAGPGDRIVEGRSDGRSRPVMYDTVTIEDTSSEAESINIGTAAAAAEVVRHEANGRAVNESGPVVPPVTPGADEVVRSESNEFFADEGIFNNSVSRHTAGREEILPEANEEAFDIDEVVANSPAQINTSAALNTISDGNGETSTVGSISTSTPGKRRRVSFHRSAKEQDGAKDTPGVPSTKKRRRLRSSPKTPEEMDSGIAADNHRNELSESLVHIEDQTGSESTVDDSVMYTSRLVPPKIQNPKVNQTPGCRRSQRTRVPRLDHAIRQHIIYKNEDGGMRSVAGIANPRIREKYHRKHGFVSTDYPKSKTFDLAVRSEFRNSKYPLPPASRPKKSKKPTKKATNHHFDSELEDDEYKHYENQTANITMFDTMANENVVTRCIHFGRENSYVNMDRKPATEADPVVFSNKLVLDTFRSGVLELRPGGRKKLQWVKLEMPIFFVVSGFVQVTFCTVIETSPDQSQNSSRTLYKKNSVDLKAGDDFCVPFGNAYEIENLRKNKPAQLRFLLLRPPSGDQP